MKRVLTIAAAFAFVSAVPAVGVFAATSASAAGGTTCSSGSGTTKVSPGLTETPTVQNVTSKGALSGCTGTVKSAKTLSHLKSGASTCAQLALGTGSLSGTEIIKWSPHGSGNSMANITITGTGPGSPANLTGNITSGPFAGMSISSSVNTTAVFKTHSKKPQCSAGNALKKATFKLASPFTIS